jgi:hypothetical protein
MEYAMFADESGTNDGLDCFAIGCILIPVEVLDEFYGEVTALIKKHNIPNNELKWEGIRNSHGRVNFLIDVVKLLLADNPYVFVSMVVLKEPYRKWRSDKEEAFYTCHTELMTFCARELNSTLVAKIDDKSDAYDKHHEVVKIIANYNLKNGGGQIKSVNRENSRDELLIQVADLITGAITAGHNLFQAPDMDIHAGKRLAIQKIAASLGWDGLHYDTWPNTKFNIWHFPTEFRATPMTENVRPMFDVPYVTRGDF